MVRVGVLAIGVQEVRVGADGRPNLRFPSNHIIHMLCDLEQVL